MNDARYAAALRAIEVTLMARIAEAAATAAADAATAFAAIDRDATPPTEAYFVAAAHQKLFARLCGADPETFAGGDPDIAAVILRNGQELSAHYWARTDPGASHIRASTDGGD